MKPNTMNKYGAVLDDFGFDAMLTKLMEDFLSPIAKGHILLILSILKISIRALSMQSSPIKPC